MTTSDDDDWAELARELKVEKAAETTSDRPADETAESDDEFTDDVLEAEGEIADGGEDLGSAAEDGADGDTAAGEGQVGTGRKRRRRRRRRKKGGPDAAAAGTEVVELAEAESPETEPAEAEFEEEPVAGGEEPGAAEEVGGELLRELIAGWNVPSWDEIVAGLQRPDR